MSWLVKSYSRIKPIREERIANYMISRFRRVADNAFGSLIKIQGPSRHNGAKAEGCQRDCCDMGCVAQHAENTLRQTRHGAHPSR